MDIRFISTLTAEDENHLAPALIAAVGSLLDRFSIPYTVRIETTGDKVFQHTHPACERVNAIAEPPRSFTPPV